MNITSMNAIDLYKTLADPSRVKADFSTPEAAAREAKNFDRFESSGVDSIENLMGLNSSSSFMCIKASLGMSDNEIAEHVGGIGKRLDEAYKAGKFTETEYNELNKSLDDYAVKLANRCKRAEAFFSLTRNITPAGFSMKTQKAESMTAEEFIADRNAEIETYIKQNPIDFKLIFKLISAFRYGTK